MRDMNYVQMSLDLMGQTGEPLILGNSESGGVESLSLEQKIDRSFRTLRLAADMSKKYYDAPLIVCYSGGKDSEVLLDLAEKCLKPDDFMVQNSHTTVDAPETVRHIREVFKRLEEKGIKTEILYAKYADGSPITMWNLIPKKLMPPTRIVRYCCQYLKEQSTPNRLACLGVRAAESSKRQGRDTFGIRGGNYRQATFFSLDHAEEVHRESQEIQDSTWDCTLIKLMKEHGSTVVNPIYEWTDQDVWDYINREKLKVNPLYEKGKLRIGCILCPMASWATMQKEMAEYPKYKQAYISAFDRMLKVRDQHGLTNQWKNGEEVFEWWIEQSKHECKGQYNLFDEDIYG